MKKKIMTITYTCPEDKVNMGETDIMGYILQKLGELGAYDINMKASTANLVEPIVPEAAVEIKIPEFMKQRSSRTKLHQIAREGGAYGKTV